MPIKVIKVFPEPPVIIPSPPQPDPNISFAIDITDALGNNIALTTRDLSSGYFLTRGSQGLDMPPVDLFSDALPASDGDYYRGMRYKPREVFLPILTHGNTQPLARERQRRLMQTVDPRRGEIRIRVTQADGSARSVYGRYSGGSEGNWSEGNWYKWWSLIGFTFRCFDPYFYGDTLSRVFSLGSTSHPFLSTNPADEFFPIVLTSSDIDFTEIEYNNPGDVEGYATFTIVGPVTDVVIGVVETGQSFQINSVPAGQTAIVTTKRPLQSVKKSDGTNWWSKLEPGSVLFPFPAGRSTLSIVATGVSTATSVSVDLQPRYIVS